MSTLVLRFEGAALIIIALFNAGNPTLVGQVTWAVCVLAAVACFMTAEIVTAIRSKA